MRITSIGHPENPSELVDGKITNIPNLEFWRLRAHFQFDDLDLIRYDRGFITFVKGIVEHVYCVCVEFWAEAGPFESE